MTTSYNVPAARTFAHALRAVRIGFSDYDLSEVALELLAEILAQNTHEDPARGSEREEALNELFCAGLVVALPTKSNPYNMVASEHSRSRYRGGLAAIAA